VRGRCERAWVCAGACRLASARETQGAQAGETRKEH
jgi:hypothetical protein